MSATIASASAATAAGRGPVGARHGEETPACAVAMGMERFPGQGRVPTSSQSDHERAADHAVPLVPEHSAVLALQKTAGNAAVSGMMVARDPLSELGDWGRVVEDLPDSKAVDWRPLAGAVTGPETPPEFESAARATAPPQPPGGYPNARANRGLGEPDPALQRALSWDDWEQRFGELAATWNGMRQGVQQFHDATKGIPDHPGTHDVDEETPSLTEAHDLQPQRAGSLSDVVEAQVVPRSNDSGITVGKLFGEGNSASTAGLGRNIARARGDATVEEQLVQVRSADLALKAAVLALAARNDEAAAAGDAALAAQAAIDEEAAEDDKAEAEADKTAIEGKVETVKSLVGGALDVLGTGATLLSKVAAQERTGGKPSDGRGSAEAFAGVAANDLVSTAAEGVVSLFFRGDLARVRARIDAATARAEQAQDTKHEKLLSSALKAHSGALKQVQAQAVTVQQKLSDRRAAYLRLAQGSAGAGGGSEADRDRLSALIAAIPLVEAAIGAARTVSARISEPAYTRQAGRGFGMALYHGDPRAWIFLRHLAMLRGYGREFTGEAERWTQRRASLAAVIAQLEQVPEPEASR